MHTSGDVVAEVRGGGPGGREGLQRDGFGDAAEDDRVQWSRESQSACKPCDMLRSCSLSTRNDGRSSGQ
jgi:hypothetical protein